MGKEIIKTLLNSSSNIILFFLGLVFYKLSKIERSIIMLMLGVDVILIILYLLLLIIYIIIKIKP